MDNIGQQTHGIYALSVEQRRELALALLARSDIGKDGLEALRKQYPSVPDAMLHTAAHHVYVDGPGAVLDFLADAELAIREPHHEVDYGPASEVLYHLFNWLQLRAIFPEGKQDLLDLVDELDKLVRAKDWDAVAGISEELKDVIEGSRSPPDMP
jgi:hypothetical protein